MKNKTEMVAMLLRNIVLAILYLLSGKISFAFFQQDLIVTLTVFIPEGIALAAVLIYGQRIIPGIFFGQLLLALSSGVSFSPALGISIGNALEAFIAYRLFYYFKLDKSLSHFRDLMGLFLLIFLILQPFSAFLGNSILLAFHTEQESEFLNNLFFWWFGNSVGQLFISPMLLLLYHHKQKEGVLKQLLHYTLVAIIFILLNYFLQIALEIHNTSLLLIATLPLTIYLATINLPYATIATFSLVGSSFYFFHLHQGTFFLAEADIDQLINLNFFALSHILLVLIIGVLFHEKEAAITSLRSLAHYDALTGLPNRYLLQSEIQESLYLFERFSKKSVICFMDIDNFKTVNDNYGHAVGDKLLQEFTKHTKQVIRLTDTLLRLGGDEFILILRDVDKEATKQLLTRIMDSVHRIKKIDHNKIAVSLSIGVASCPADGTTVQELINAADSAMYQVKQSGKNGMAFSKSCCKPKE